MSTDTNAADLAAQAFINGLNAEKGAALAAEVEAAFLESEKRGFEKVLPAMTSLGVSWDVVAAWKPATLRADDVSAGEHAIRTLHNLARPKSSPASRDKASKALQAAREAFPSNAFDGAMGRRPIANKLPEFIGSNGKDAPYKTHQEAREALSTITDGAWDDAVAAADAGNFSALYDHVEAACRTLEAALNDAAKFRRLVFLPLIEPTIRAALETNGSGDKIETTYDGACGAAYSALHPKNGTLGKARANGPITGDQARDLVCAAVAEHLGAKFNPAELSREDKIAKAVAAIAAKLERLHNLKALADTNSMNAIKAFMASHGIVFPSATGNGEVKQEQDAVIDAAPAPVAATPAPVAPSADSVAAANVANTAPVTPAPAPLGNSVMEKAKARTRRK